MILPETIFLTEIKGHNSDNNQWILSIIEFDLYFMIIYVRLKYESNDFNFEFKPNWYALKTGR